MKNANIAGNIYEDGNSESFNTGSWKNATPIHLTEKCRNCMLCVPICPENAILHNDDNKMCGFDLDKCKGCGACSVVCPFKAIEMKAEEE